jgi:hypothetical protein
MVCGVFTVKAVPADQVDQVADLFQTNDPPPTSVTKTPDGSGAFTVVATWPPCPTGTTHDPGDV